MSDIKALTQSVYGEMSQDGDIDTMVDTYFAEDFVEHEEIPGLERFPAAMREGWNGREESQ